MEKQKRTEFSTDQSKMMEEAYDQGMRKGKAWLRGHQDLAVKLNLTEIQVKNWLGNHHKSKSGPGITAPRTTLPAVRPTAYSLFCKEYSKDHPGFHPTEWKLEWEAITKTEKDRYAQLAKEKADELDNLDPSSRKKTIRTLLKQLEWTSRRLENMGLPNFALVAESDTVHSVGSGRGRDFLNKEGIEPMFSTFCNQEHSTPEKHKILELRKAVQAHMNELYRQASGKSGCFPYKMVRNGDIVVEGLPQTVLPLHPPSHYGEEKLQLLLSCPSISISYSQLTIEPPSSTSASNEPSTSASNEPSTSTSTSLEILPSLSQHTSTEVQHQESNLIGILGVTSELGTDVSVEERSLVSSAVYVEPNVREIKKEMRKMTKRKGRSKGKESKAKSRKLASDDEPFYYVERIVGERRNKGKTEYCVKWEGFEEPTWEPERNIPTHIIEEFLN